MQNDKHLFQRKNMKSKLLEYISTLHKYALGRLMLLRKLCHAGIVPCARLPERGHNIYFNILNFNVNFSFSCNFRVC